jgi:GT2 family glycosyltransferase
MVSTTLYDRADEIGISVIIVSYHCRDEVMACVESLLASRPTRRVEITVIDNGSTDGTLEFLRQRAPEVQVVPMGTNAGFSKANNVGMSRALGRHILILNPDTIVEPGALDTLADWLDSHDTAGVAAPQLRNADGSDQRTARSFPTPAAALFGRRSPLTRWFPGNRWSSRFLSGRATSGTAPFRIDWVSGAAMMVPASVIAQVGGFDEDFFLFWEDAEWCRIRRVVRPSGPDHARRRGHARPWLGPPSRGSFPSWGIPLLAQAPRTTAMESRPMARRRRPVRASAAGHGPRAGPVLPPRRP